MTVGKDKLMTAETTMELMLGFQQSQKPLIWLDYYKLNHTWQLTISTAWDVVVWGLLYVTDVSGFSLPPPAHTGLTLQAGLSYPLLSSKSILVTWTTWLLQMTCLWGKDFMYFLAKLNHATVGIYQNSDKRGRKNGSKENIAKILSSENTHSVRRLYRDPKIIYIYLYKLLSMCD